MARAWVPCNDKVRTQCQANGTGARPGHKDKGTRPGTRRQHKAKGTRTKGKAKVSPGHTKGQNTRPRKKDKVQNTRAHGPILCILCLGPF